MEHKVYTKSRALFERAIKKIPAGIYGHLGPAEGCYIPVQAFPFFGERAEGPYIWDVDGNRFIDYMCAYGPNILGYNDPDVDAAALKQMEKGNCMTLPSYKLVEFAELITDTVEMADWAFFAKNGGDVTNFSIMIARAETGRSKIITFEGCYHGVAQWMQPLGSPGIITEDRANILQVPWNDIPALKKTIAEHADNIAGIISTPYKHGVFADSELPAEGFWQAVREICDEKGIVLIVDDVRAGFRLNVKGSDYHYGFKADLVCFCKALANGYNVSCLCGRDSLKNTAASVMYTGSYWLSAVPFAAGIATVTKLREIDSARITKEKGKKLTDGLHEAGTRHGFDLKISGEPSMWYMRITNDDTLELHQEWVSECVKRDVFFTNHHNQFINTALSDTDIQRTIDVADRAFALLRERHPDA